MSHGDTVNYIEVPNLMTSTQYNAIGNWIERNGGHRVHPKDDALKVLEEMIELCYASGAQPYEVEHVVLRETQKALSRKEASGSVNQVEAFNEVGDVLVCAAAYCHKWDIKGPETVKDTLGRMASRKWAPDEGGVLRRPRGGEAIG